MMSPDQLAAGLETTNNLLGRIAAALEKRNDMAEGQLKRLEESIDGLSGAIDDVERLLRDKLPG